MDTSSEAVFSGEGDAWGGSVSCSGVFVEGINCAQYWLGSGPGGGLGSAAVTPLGFGLLVTSIKSAGGSKIISSGSVLFPLDCEAALFVFSCLVWSGGPTGDGRVFEGVKDGGVDLAGAAGRVGTKDVG